MIGRYMSIKFEAVGAIIPLLFYSAFKSSQSGKPRYKKGVKHKRKGTNKQVVLVAVEHQGAVRSDLVANDMSILVLTQDGARMLKINDKDFFFTSLSFLTRNNSLFP